LLAVLGLAGCGSMAAAELPAPAGVVAGAQRVAEFSVDPAGDRLVRADGASVRTGREPTAVAVLDRGTKVAVLCGRERVLEVYDARTLKRLGRTGAGIGPVGLATDGAQLLYVTDSEGDALLVFHLRPRFELIRRVHVIGGPYAIAFDQDRWELTIGLERAGKVVKYAAGNRPVWRETVRR
jgi:DNA-binding beta-propeller fold protein YncE